MNRKSIYSQLAIALVCTTFLYGCSAKTEASNTNETQTAATEVKASIIGDKSVKSVIGELVTYDKEDTYTDWENENLNYIELSGTTASIKGSGAEIKEQLGLF